MTDREHLQSERAFPPSDHDLTRVGELDLANAAGTRGLGAAVAKSIGRRGFVGLVGPLGAGKTTLVTGFMREHGAEDAVTRSPTYTLLNVYRTTPPVVHVDLYRLGGVDDLESIGYWDYVQADRRVILVEWFDRVLECWPGEGLIVELAHQQSGRHATLWASDTYCDVAETILSSFDSTASDAD